jgi:feruloyl esterase
MSNPRKALDYAYRAVNLTATTAKEMTRHYYGKAVSRSYWNSCSNGGRQGLIEAERYPRDFDGILVNSPWVDQTGFTVGAMWNQKAVSSAALTPAKLALVADKVMAKCDALDGLKDGLIDDPRVCRFDARADVPACPAGEDGESCLTAVEADAMMRVYVGPVSHGKSLFPGFMFGSEAVVPAVFGGGPAASGWMNVIVPAQAGRNSADFNLAEGIMRYLVHTPPQAQYDYREFDFDRDVGTLAAWGKKANATDTDLAAVRHRGGKLIMTYGWADTILQPMMGVDYYKRAVARNGRDTPEFFRLFMVPGMGHCGGGIGTERFDAMTALIDWVEKGKAPDSIRAARVVDNREVRSRPLCVYPQVARYSGQGSIDEAANFSCVVP